MKQVWTAILLCILTGSRAASARDTCYPVKHANLPAITELKYHEARKMLLAAGWQPVMTKSYYNDPADDPDISSGNGQEFWRRGYFEVEACSGTGLAFCSFLFSDAYNNQLRVSTAGEEDSKNKRYATVEGYGFICEQPAKESIHKDGTDMINNLFNRTALLEKTNESNSSEIAKMKEGIEELKRKIGPSAKCAPCN